MTNIKFFLRTKICAWFKQNYTSVGFDLFHVKAQTAHRVLVMFDQNWIKVQTQNTLKKQNHIFTLKSDVMYGDH